MCKRCTKKHTHSSNATWTALYTPQECWPAAGWKRQFSPCVSGSPNRGGEMPTLELRASGGAPCYANNSIKNFKATSRKQGK